ncbi:MAG: hypothetical protein HDS06_04580 [Bacteroides sp.]|nr:hypothetical protein [Bacteroides sp.]
MRVITLDSHNFTAACRDLAREVAASGFTPSLIIGIRTGGEFVAREFVPFFPASRLAIVSLHRPSTASKSPFRRVLASLPRPVLDLMRVAESRLLSLLPKRRVPRVELPGELTGALSRRVLVVDDAADSGVTLLAIAEAVRRVRPDADIRTAVLTVTTASPAVVPDFALYRNRTLLRFPWSMDMKRQ